MDSEREPKSRKNEKNEVRKTMRKIIKTRINFFIVFDVREGLPVPTFPRGAGNLQSREPNKECIQSWVRCR